MIVRNVVGGIIALIGIALIPVPAPGVIILLLGLVIMDFPGKREAERFVLRLPGTVRIIKRFREHKSVEPLCLGGVVEDASCRLRALGQEAGTAQGDTQMADAPIKSDAALRRHP